MCLLAMVLMGALGAGLIMATTTEALIAGNFRSDLTARASAIAIAERALADLQGVPDWTPVLNGVVTSRFIDGAPGYRRLADGGSIDLQSVLNLLNCRRAAGCSAAQMDASTADRPWGPNNPHWRVFASGRIDALASGVIRSMCYGIALVADDQLENDGDPLRDGVDASNPGSGILRLRSEALCGKAARRGVDIALVRDPLGTRVIWWHETERLDRP